MNNNFDKNNNDTNQKKDINYLKNNIQKISQYKIKHVNSIYVSRTVNKNEKKNEILRIPVFTVVKPENLISFEYNREYETRVSRNNVKNNVISIKNFDNHLNETNIKDKKDNEENDKNKSNKRSKSLFCCL